MREKSIDVTVGDEMGNAVIGVRTGANLHIDARLESLHDGILVSGDVDATAEGECVRCLIDVSIPVEVEFAELFAYSFDEAFDYTVQDDHVDLEPLSGMRWCSHYRFNRSVRKIASACAQSVGYGFLTIRATSMRLPSIHDGLRLPGSTG